uniref:Hook C-terminal domain-containing protein n=2 Tax=Eptatretus burgeri TaxID=7764 RepID=A0A8C4PZB7_EPTBU
MEERYKRYLEKAKSVIRTLDPKTTSLGPGEPATGEYQVLRNKLLEKDKLLELKQRELERTKQQRELEDKLMVTAWYNIGRVSQQQASELRLCPSPATLSFLSWQRQAVRAHKRYVKLCANKCL